MFSVGPAILIATIATTVSGTPAPRGTLGSALMNPSAQVGSVPFSATLRGRVDRCESGEARACADAADRYLRRYIANGEQVTRDPALAFRFMERACDLRDGLSCFELAFDYAYGREGFIVDVRRGRQFLSRGCDAGFEPSCTAVRVGALEPPLEVDGVLRPRQFDDEALPPLEAQTRCLDGDLQACTCAAAHQDSPLMSAVLYEHGCKHGGALACYLFAETLTSGRLSQAGFPSWHEPMERSCRLGYWSACEWEVVFSASSSSVGDLARPAGSQ